MRHLAGYAVLPILVLVSAGCGGDSTSAAPEDCSGPPVVTVHDAGTEPHQVMEMSPEVGDTVALDMLMTTRIGVRVDGDSVPVESSPPMLMGMEMTVDDVTADEIAMSFVYDKAEVEGGDPEAQEMLDTMVGVSGTITTTRSGAYTDGSVDLAGLHPALSATMGELEQQLADLTIPLPTEPVGVNAKWDVANSVEGGGVTFCQTASYTLAEFDGDTYELDVEVTQNAVPTDLEEGGVPIELKEGSGSVSGSSSGSLGMPIAFSGTSEGTTTMKMEIDQNGSTVTQEVSADIEVEITPRDEG